MKNCRYKRRKAFVTYGAMILFFSAGIGLFALWLIVMVQDFSAYGFSPSLLLHEITFSVVPLGLAGFLLYLAVATHTLESRRFSVSEEGLTLSDKGKCFYKWSEIYDINIVAFGASSSLQSFESVVCCYLRPWTMQDQKKLLTGYFFAARNPNRFVIIDYDPAIVAEFARFYHRPILDWRKRQTGRKESML